MLNTNSYTMRQYEMIQKRFCKWSLPHVSYKEALLLLNILPIPMYMQIIDILFMSKLNTNYYDYYIQDLPNITTDGYLRQKLFPFLQRPRNVKCEDNYLYRTPRLIQNIPHCVKFLHWTKTKIFNLGMDTISLQIRRVLGNCCEIAPEETVDSLPVDLHTSGTKTPSDLQLKP